MGADQEDGQLNAVEATPSIGRLRILIGFLQGIVAWLLLRQVAPVIYGPGSMIRSHVPFWSERHPMLFAALAVITAYIPIIAIAQLPRMRRRRLLIYLLLTGAAIAGLAAYDIWRDPLEHYGTDSRLRIWPSGWLGIYATLGLFVVNQLLEHRERGSPLFAEYSRHFEDGWTRGFQLVTSVIFSLLFWGVLELGATLFDLIHVGWFRSMIQHNWFICPALAMAFAAAVHMTDVRPELLNGTRNVVLTLLSWLLPLVTALSLGFLIALLFVGLRPLWETRHAASILFTACAATILLLNAAYKDGESMPSNPLLRWCGLAAGPILLPLALIGSYAIALRVNQYGWTADRVTSAAIAIMALIYSCGYLYAATRRTGWLKPLETVNVFAGLAVIAILLLLLTPVADPARLSVNSQLARLAKGEVSSSKLDYYFLRFDSGVYGRNALAKLVAGANEDARARAARVQATSFKRYNQQGDPDGAVSDAAFSHATIYPKGVQLPPDFGGATEEQAGYLTDPRCMHGGSVCDIYVVPYGKDGKESIIVRSIQKESALAPGYPSGATAELYQRDADGKWIELGTLQHLDCPGVASALQNGDLAAVPPEHDDLMVAGVRLEFSLARPAAKKCAAPAPPVTSLNKEPAHDPGAPAHMGPAFGAPAGR